LTIFELRKPVKGIKWPHVAVFQDDPQPRHPVGALPEDQVAHDVERAPGIFSFIAVCPSVGQSAQQSIEDWGSAAENCDGLVQAEFRQACHALADDCRGTLDSCEGAECAPPPAIPPPSRLAF
jgi:hypothetical protein